MDLRIGDFVADKNGRSGVVVDVVLRFNQEGHEVLVAPQDATGLTLTIYADDITFKAAANQ
jgi:hypothetical protein